MPVNRQCRGNIKDGVQGGKKVRDNKSTKRERRKKKKKRPEYIEQGGGGKTAHPQTGSPHRKLLVFQITKYVAAVNNPIPATNTPQQNAYLHRWIHGSNLLLELSGLPLTSFNFTP